MCEINRHNYKEYIGRFLQAETTLAEEKALYHFFAQADLPTEAEPLRKMFGWYAAIPESSSKAAATPTPTSQRFRFLRLRAVRFAGIAAATALLFGTGLFLLNTHNNIPDEYLAYEGSYIIRDGKKITDLAIVVPEIKRAEALRAESLNSIDDAIGAAELYTDTPVIQDLDLITPDMTPATYPSF